MAYEMKPNTASLFKNDNREKLQPHNKGSALIDGKEYWVSGWENQSANGVEYQSLKFQLKELTDAKKQGFSDMSDDVPY